MPLYWSYKLQVTYFHLKSDKFRTLLSEWRTRHQLSHSVFSPFFVLVLSWQRHFLSDRQVFCDVTLKAPWIALGVTCYLCQVKLDLHSLCKALTYYSASLNGVRPPSFIHKWRIFFLLMATIDQIIFFLLLQQVKNALKYTVGFAIVCVVLLLIG